MHCKQTGWSLKCFIYSLVSQSNYISSHQALSFHTLTGCQILIWKRVAILKVGQSAHLTSFPNTVLCLSQKSLLIGVHLKSGLWAWREGYGGYGEIRAAAAYSLRKELFGARLLTAVSYNGFQLTKGKDWELIWSSTGEPVMQYSCTQTNESPD